MTSPDQKARDAAIDPSRSFVVQAPAGSGKTSLLIQRYLALLAQVDTPEEVVALTFTRKAAEEMHGRVIAALAAAGGEPPVNTHDRHTQWLAQKVVARSYERDWFLLDCPGRIRIQTFDGLCTQIVAQWPAAAGVGVTFAVSETPEALYTEAAYATFQLLAQDSAVATALTDLLPALANDVDRFTTLVAALLARREQWMPIVLGSAAASPEAVRQRLEAALVSQAQAALMRAQALCPDGILMALCSYLEAVTGEDCWHIANLRQTGSAALALWQQLAPRVLTKEGKLRKRLNGWPKTLGPHADIIAQLEGLEEWAQSLGQLSGWGLCRYSEDQWQRVSALIQILPAASAQLLMVFARAQQWDFTEVALRALQALGVDEEPTEGALRLDRKLRHILVDEFQDTSVLQYRLLERLTAGWQLGDNRSLFVVGDPMQSIYAFRKAEVSLFFRLAEEGIGGWPLEALALTANFRSYDRIVDWVNKCFSAVLPPSFVADEGAVPHVAATAAVGAGGAVHTHPLGAVDLETEAQYVASLVADSRRAAAGEKIAILVRSRGHGHAIASALAQRGLRFSAVELYSLAARPVILDLLALTEALVFPAARLSALSGLRAPWCGLDLADLMALCEGDARPLLGILEDEGRVDRLSAAGRVRAKRLRDVLAHAEANRARMPLVRRVEEAWIGLGGPAALEAETGLLEAELFFRILTDEEEACEIDIWRLRDRLNALYAPPDPLAEGLHILTIHKAKGLEFDTVICPGLGRNTKSDQRPLLLALEASSEAGVDLLLAPLKAQSDKNDALYECLWDLQGRKRQHELGRLLYVACTRARSTLHLVGHCGRDAAGEPQPRGLLSVLWPVIQEAYAAPIADVAPPTLSSPKALRLKRLPLAAIPQEALRSATDVTEEAVVSESLAFDWAGTRIRLVGVVVHALLAELATSVLPAPGSLPHALREQAGSLLQGHGLHGPDRDEALNQVVAALERALADDRGRWLLGPHEGARNEWALSAWQGLQLTTVRVDRTFVDSEGVRWVIDYKTSRHEGSDEEAFLDREVERYRPQLAHYGDFFTRLESRPVELALYFPLLSAFRHWRYEAPVTF